MNWLTGLAMVMSEEDGMTVNEFDKRMSGIRRNMLNNGWDISVFESENVREAKQMGRNMVAERRKER